jgi:hypothetical protein
VKRLEASNSAQMKNRLMAGVWAPASAETIRAMLPFPTRPGRGLLVFVILTLACATAQAQAAEPAGQGFIARNWQAATDMNAWRGEGFWRLAAAPYAPHFRYSEEHRAVVAVAIERQRPDRWLAGLSLFRNSFGQPSAYGYVGRRHPDLFDVQPLFFQWSVGVLYGYKGKYKNKVALNVGGFAPGALVGLGWQVNRDTAATVHLLGDAAVMFQFSYDLR